MTDIVIVPAAPVVPPFPALGAPDFNQAAYTWGSAMPSVSAGVQAIAATAQTNATAAQERATSAATSAATGTAQADLAMGYRNTAGAHATAATTQAGIATIKADEAAASALQASKLNLGNKSAAPATDNQGAALLAGTTYYDTTLDKWRVWTGTAWGEGVSAVAGVSSINGLTGDVVLPQPQFVAYTDRANLRSQTPANGEIAIVDGLGLFVFTPASTEPDDDESCFSAATGCWLLQAAHWDLVDAWQLPEVEERDAYDEDEPLRFDSSFASKVLTGFATCAITSVANVASASFTGTVIGAAAGVGDRVIATPPAELGATAAETGRLGYHAWVSAANTVTVMLTNASAAAANTNAAIRTAWPITVIKS